MNAVNITFLAEKRGECRNLRDAFVGIHHPLRLAEWRFPVASRIEIKLLR
jgi:hypothetical protein